MARAIVVCLAVAGLALPTLVRADAGGPSVTVSVTEKPPVIDGKLDDAGWESAASFSGFRGIRTGEPVAEQTVVRMVYDDRAVYFGVRCEEPVPAGLVAQATREREVWATDDAVSVMLDAGDANTYFQFAVTPRGIDFDQKVVTAPKERKLYGEFEPEWDVAVSVGEDAWIAEMAIPYKALDTAPQMGRTWRMNILRTRRQAEYEKNSLWAYAANLHIRENWGKVHGITFGAESPAGLTLMAVDTGAGNVGRNRFTAEFDEPLPEGAVVVLTVTSPSGAESEFSAAAGGKVDVEYRIVAEEGTHELVATARDTAGKLLFRSPPAMVRIGDLLDSYVERNYYTTEALARVICLAPVLDAETLVNCSLDAALAGTTVAREVTAPLRERTIVELPLGEIVPGTYAVSVKMKNREGRVFASQELELRKLPPGPGSEVKIVRRDRSAYLLVDGEPYFMLGTDVHSYPGDMFELVDEMAASGFNMLSMAASGLYNSDEARAKTLKIMDACHAHNMMVCVYPERMPWVDGPRRERWEGWRTWRRWQRYEDWGLWKKDPGGLTPDDPTDLQRIHQNVANVRRWVEQFKDHPAVLLYHGFDEAMDINQKEDEIYMHFLRDVDPYHPFERIFGPGAIIDRYGDIYNVHRYMCTHRPLTAPYENARRNKPIANADRKPLHVFLGSLTSSDFRGPTAEELRCQMYMVLIGGGRGIVWFRGRHPQLACWNAVKRVTHEVSQLIPVLLEPDVPQEISVDQADSKPVYVWLMRHEGRRWILAANCRKSPTDATIVLPDLEAGTKVKVHFEDRVMSAEAGRLPDTYGEYGVHVYEVLE